MPCIHMPCIHTCSSPSCSQCGHRRCLPEPAGRRAGARRTQPSAAAAVALGFGRRATHSSATATVQCISTPDKSHIIVQHYGAGGRRMPRSDMPLAARHQSAQMRSGTPPSVPYLPAHHRDLGMHAGLATCARTPVAEAAPGGRSRRPTVGH